MRLQAQLDQFVHEYNQQRPHRSLAVHTPTAAYHARPKATPSTSHQAYYRVRHDRVSHGNISLRVIMLIDDLDVRVIHATTGEIIRTVTIDSNRGHHGTGAPIGGPRRPYGPPKNETSRTLTQVRRSPMS